MMTWLSSSENIYHRKKTKSMEKLNYIYRHSSHSLKGSGFSGDGKIKGWAVLLFHTRNRADAAHAPKPELLSI